MQLIRGYKQQNKLTNHFTAKSSGEIVNQCVATIGNFDGVHLGHQTIIQRVTQIARQMGLLSCVILFEPHPKEYFLKQNSPPRITRLRQKYQQLKNLGVDRLLVLRFDYELSQMKAEDFIKTILIDSMQVRHLVVGDDFRFGYQRQGDFEQLKQVGQGQFTLEPTQTVYLHSPDGDNQVRVSSTRIRQALVENDFEMARRLLGRRFSLCGKVQYGRQLGRTIGFPTANIALQRKSFPLKGVYWGRGVWQDPNNSELMLSSWAVANCGDRPTVEGKHFKLEVHLLGMTAALYGIELAFEFFGFLRPEQKFDGIDALTEQIRQDVDAANCLIKAYEDQQN